MNPQPSSLYRSVAALLITVTVGAVCGRILAVNQVYEPHLYRQEGEPEDGRRFWPAARPMPVPTFGSNDRSRWATVRALVEQGTYVIGRRDEGWLSYGDDGLIFEDGWFSVDKVLRPGPETKVREFYSSKPPLFSTLVAGEYWLLYHGFGLSLGDPQWGLWVVVRVGLLTFNALPLLLYLLLLARLVERLGTTDWGRLFVLATACFATFVTTFAVTLNNHSPAAYCTLFALCAVLPVLTPHPPAPSPTQGRGGEKQPTLPPLPPVGEGGGGVRGPGAWWHFALAGLLAAFTATLEMPAASFTALLLLLLLLRSPGRTLLFAVPAAAVPVAAFFVTNYLALGQFQPVQSEFGSQWYDYPGSNFHSGIGHGIDYAWQQESRAAYAFHFLLGHHGFFSLTPVWLPALAAMLWGAGRLAAVLGRERSLASLWSDKQTLPLLAALGLVVSAAVLVFYLGSITHGNYGGWTSGPRWLIWLTPLWLVALAPAADWLSARRWGRGLAYVLLAVSVLSASYPAWNPWRHPWLYNALQALGWVRYS
jgi:hypothetical protein